MHIFFRTALLGMVAAALGTQTASASNDRVSFAKNITVTEGDPANDIVCIACSVTLQGDVHGDIVTVLGGIKAEGSRAISGDVVALGGDVILPASSTLQGDLVVIGGDLDLGPEASVHGDRSVFPGRAWIFLPFAPLLILVGIVWLAIWLVRRNRYRFPMYPYGRGL
ncbi:hypothetical protein HDF16_003963 [Granulicella aggregans]|uniref:Polymer-forming cytoskeletal protein n=1 Tax=Granulicella aggregans TaxID=474949 RepID=A0A7W8E6H0_9BACT|nr:hypothetical protein [Granulicella aggregans]MBB5059240.1 hypothetical protein [Granulicella aggregans]